ncbi:MULTISPECIES: hypothetical protein [unclassified Chryseobacterium]|uniref:hypothetical protein n=1 Tax=unclassified Chryseobacterium TaxID=2593645 RepID=UPI00226A9C1B|nr:MULTISPECIES: hypothetical protein [unclassified Chryseobacterium]
MMKYKIAAIIIVITYFVHTFFLPTGGIGADSLSYFGIASDLPKIKTNLFPLGYPLLLEIGHFFTKDYFWSSKILNLLLTSTILLFSYFKKYYFRETVLLFMGKTFFFVFAGTLSEGTFIFFLYFMIYFLHQVFMKKNMVRNAVFASIALTCLFTVRYSGVYIYLSALVFGVFVFNKIKNKEYFKPYLFFVILSGIGVGGYLLFNFLNLGNFTGENLRGKPIWISYIYTVRDIFGLANAVDPYIGIKPASNSLASMAFQFFVFVIDILLFRYLLTYYRKAKGTQLYYFHQLLWITAAVYGVSLLLSGYFQQIEEMGVRLQAAANVCLFFSFLILYFQNQKSDKWIWRIGCFFFVFLVAYSLKSPSNYLKNKHQIQPQMEKFKDKVYIYNDQKEIKNVTKYHIPIINKSFTYEHTNNQKGEIKQSLAGTFYPQIKWVKYDTVRDKSKVLYTSWLILD